MQDGKDWQRLANDISWDGEYESRAGRNSERVRDSKQTAKAERGYCSQLN